MIIIITAIYYVLLAKGVPDVMIGVRKDTFFLSVVILLHTNERILRSSIISSKVLDE